VKKKRPDLTVIKGGKTDPKPTVSYEEISLTVTEETSISDIIQQWQQAVTRDYRPSDDFFIMPADFPGMDFLSSNVSITATFLYDEPRDVAPKIWTELADMVDRWRGARDEFTLAALNEELRAWLNRK
jgi:hypothetical protein